jgi:deoxyadenosine/deoxycytidine kinase
MNTIISIEGNIGSGKSTLLLNLQEEFKDNKNIIFLKEPVDEWETFKDETGITMLEKFYKNQEKYSFPFQMMAFISRLSLLKSFITQNPGAIFITERSLYTDKMVFAKMLYDIGKIELINYKIYLKWFDTFISECAVSHIIYVKTDPNICFNRITKRSRTGESNISIEYLKNCHKYHENMLDKTLEDCVCNNQLTLDGNIDIYENNECLKEWIKKVKEIVNK